MVRYGVETYLNTKHSRESIKSYNRSMMEIEIFEWIKEISPDANHSDRKIIPPLLIDIYIPSANLAIEFNGLYWHSEFHKDKKYHLNKTNMCKDLGIDLIHIWEDDWINRKDVLKSIILNRIGFVNNRICQIF
jgi:very-short-patch-repair endonuclease